MSGFTAALSAATKIPAELKKLGKAEMAETVLNVSQGAYDLMGENLDLKEKLSILNEENRKLHGEIDELKSLNSLKHELDFNNDCYWDKDGFPLCSVCLEKPIDPAPIRMHSGGRTDGFVRCPACNNTTYSKGMPTY